MKKLGFASIVLIMAGLVNAQPLKAQDGPGGILDWIHRLSGPSMLGPAGSYYWTVGQETRFRVSAAARFPIASDDNIEDGHILNMFSLQPGIEIPIAGPFEFNGGLALHRLGGDGHDPVWHFSIPLFGQFRFPVNAAGTCYFRIGLGGNYFPSFDEGDFDGGVTVKTDGREFTFALIAGFDFSH